MWSKKKKTLRAPLCLSLRGRYLTELTGEVQADFVVLCKDAKERQTATEAIEAPRSKSLRLSKTI